MIYEKERSLLRNLFQQLINPAEGHNPMPLHDLFVQVDVERGDVNLYNDNDNLLAQCTLFAWADGQNPDKKALIQLVRETVSLLEQKGFWENELFVKPLSVELVDDGMNSLEQLLFLDDDIILLDEPLLKGLNSDLNKFMDELLGDIK